LMTIFAFMASLHSKACWLAHGLDGWGKVARLCYSTGLVTDAI